MVSKCISNFTRLRPPCVSPNKLDYHLQAHLHTRTITVSECISVFTLSSCSGAPRFALKHRLQAVQIYRVLMGSDIDTYNRIHTEYMSFKNCWTIRSSSDFQAHQQRCQTRCFSQTALEWFEALPDLAPVLPGWSPVIPGLSPALSCLSLVLRSSSPALLGAPRFVVSTPSYCEGRQECPPRVSYSPAIDASKFTLHILSDHPGGFQWIKYILLM